MFGTQELVTIASYVSAAYRKGYTDGFKNQPRKATRYDGLESFEYSEGYKAGYNDYAYAA